MRHFTVVHDCINKERVVQHINAILHQVVIGKIFPNKRVMNAKEGFSEGEWICEAASRLKFVMKLSRESLRNELGLLSRRCEQAAKGIA
jgi:hypothetical protein